jgi:phenylpropionate dioxygenase-like ring-hydroxylating dioxygenase large terminal subunit
MRAQGMTTQKDSAWAGAALPLDELRTAVDASPEHARALPPWAYTDPRFLALEEQRIFATRWVCVGRADALRETGDYLATSVADEPVIVIRGEDGAVRALSNVCRHRMSTLLEGRGNVRRIVCPYHAWTYNLDGSLRGAPAMERSASFCAGTVRLPAVRCEVWEGWLFLTLSDSAAPPSVTFAEVASLVEAYGMSTYVETFRDEMTWEGNWKLVAENFMESYHLPVCHSGTVGGSVSLRGLEDTVLRDDFNFHCILRDANNTLTTAHPANTRLTGDARRTTWVLALYPSLMITLSPGYFWYLCFAPDGTSRVRVLFGGGMAAEFASDPASTDLLGEARALTAAILAEDRRCVERVYRGMQSRLAEPGPLSHLESGNAHFARWVVEHVAGHAQIDRNPQRDTR